MKRYVLTAVLAVAAVACGKKDQPSETAPPSAVQAKEAPTSAQPAPPPVTTSVTAHAIYELPINTLDGEASHVGDHRGNALLIVNVASKCGLTPQYETLEALQKRYAGKGFTVLGFPCNQFGGQEPGSAEEIRTFCSTTYGVTFPMFEKIEVNGDGRHPIYEQLTKLEDAEGNAGDIQWNFEKFVVSADGNRITRFRPRTVPDAPEVIAAIEAGLPATN